MEIVNSHPGPFPGAGGDDGDEDSDPYAYYGSGEDSGVDFSFDSFRKWLEEHRDGAARSLQYVYVDFERCDLSK
jgi:hypothetical protein